MPAPPEIGDLPLDPSRAPATFGTPNSTPSPTPSPTPAPARPAEPPRAPALPLAVQRAEAEQNAALHERETLERHSLLRGLILFAVLALLVSLLRAGWSRAFPAGWQW